MLVIGTSPLQHLWQLGDVRGDASRLVAPEQGSLQNRLAITATV